MLGNNNLSHTVKVVTMFILENTVIFGTMNKTNHISILLDSTRLSEVTQHRTFSFVSFTAFQTTV